MKKRLSNHIKLCPVGGSPPSEGLGEVPRRAGGGPSSLLLPILFNEGAEGSWDCILF